MTNYSVFHTVVYFYALCVLYKAYLEVPTLNRIVFFKRSFSSKTFFHFQKTLSSENLFASKFIHTSSRQPNSTYYVGLLTLSSIMSNKTTIWYSICIIYIQKKRQYIYRNLCHLLDAHTFRLISSFFFQFSSEKLISIGIWCTFKFTISCCPNFVQCCQKIHISCLCSNTNHMKLIYGMIMVMFIIGSGWVDLLGNDQNDQL